MAYELNEARIKVLEAAKRCQDDGLIVRTWGNISARISDTQFVITPSGRAYESLSPEDIVIVDIKKCTYEGDLKPSSESGIHADVYAMRPEANFVIHTHQTYASCVSILGEDIELSEEEQTFLGDKIPCAEYGMSSSEKLRKQVKKCLKSNTKANSMLLRNHGVLCIGTDFDNAFEISSMMEQVCKYKYEMLVSGFDKVNAKGDSDENLEKWDEVLASEEDLNKSGFVDYGTSSCEGNQVKLTLGEKEYTFSLTDPKPLGKSIFKKNLNKIAKLHQKIYEDRSISNICHVTLPNIVDVSKKDYDFIPYIDDQAQIVGDDVKCVGKINKKPHFESAKAISKALKKDNAVLIAGQGALVVGGSESDVEACAYVLEKGCLAAKLALCNGKAQSVPKLIAKKERKFYVESYSKLK